MGEKKRNSIFLPMIVLGAIFLALYGIALKGSSQPGAVKPEGFPEYPFGIVGLLGVVCGIACWKKENPGKAFRFVYAVEIFYASLYFVTIFAEVYYDRAGLMLQALLFGTLLFPVLDTIFPLLALWTAGAGSMVAAVLGNFVMRLSRISVTFLSGSLDGPAVFWFFFGTACDLVSVFCIIRVAGAVKKVGQSAKHKVVGTLAAMGNCVALELAVSLVLTPLLSWVLEGDPYWRFSWLYIVFPVILCLVIAGDILLFRWLKQKNREVIRLSPEAVHG